MTATITDFTIVAQDIEGTWHVRDDADSGIPSNVRNQFAWFACCAKDGDDPAHGIERSDVALALTWTDERCPECFPQEAPDWLLEPQAVLA